MASNNPDPVIPPPIVLPPASPAELLSYVISHCRHPSVVIVGCSRQDFAAFLTADTLPPVEPVTDLQTSQPKETQPSLKHPLLRQTLLQIAVSRHIRIVFASSVTHFRVWTATFSPSDSRLPGPPAPQSSDSPVLLAYGLVGLHRGTSEWSAQGLGASAAGLIEAAARHRFKAVLLEPKDAAREDLEIDKIGTEHFGCEKLPLLNDIAMKEDGTWAGRTVELRKVLSRWFEVGKHDQTW